MWLSRMMKVGRPFVFWKDLQGVLDAVDIVGVAHAQDIPAVAEKPGSDVLGEGDARVAFDRDMVVVVDPAEVIQAQDGRPAMRPPTRRLPSGSHRRKPHRCCSRRSRSRAGCSGWRAIFARWPCPRSSRHPAQADRWSSRRPKPSDTPGARGLAVELAETADVVEGDRRLPEPLVIGVHRAGSGQVEHRPQQHGGMTVREHETVAVRPDRILRIEPQHPVPDRVDQRRERHGRAGMAGLGLLNGVDGEGADGIDGQLVQVVQRSLVWRNLTRIHSCFCHHSSTRTGLFCRLAAGDQGGRHPGAPVRRGSTGRLCAGEPASRLYRRRSRARGCAGPG